MIREYTVNLPTFQPLERRDPPFLYETDLLSTALIEDLSDKNLFDYWISSIHDSLSLHKIKLEIAIRKENDERL